MQYKRNKPVSNSTNHVLGQGMYGVTKFILSITAIQVPCNTGREHNILSFIIKK